MASAFFYGTLLHPQILQRVLGHDGQHLLVAPAVLLDFTRHRIHSRDYPAIVSSSVSQAWIKHQLSAEERSVRGTLVVGLSSDDLALIDLFEGEEYSRTHVTVYPLTACTPFINSQDAVATVLSHESTLQAQDLLTAVPAHTYIWADNPELLLPELWSFDKFVKEKLWRWVGKDSMDNQDYVLVDERTAFNSKTGSSASSYTPLPADVPHFGRTLRSQFFFEDDYVNLNHGSYGSLPRVVAAACRKLDHEIEARPDLFIRRIYSKRLEIVREHLARLVRADVNEIVMVSNATLGINTVLRNIEWFPGDMIIQFATTYGAISLSADYIRDQSPHPQIFTIPLSFPTTHANIISSFKSYIQAIPRLPSAKLVAIIDSISSNPGCLLPWKDLVKECREAGILSIVDGAHSIGQELHINLSEAQPDFWVSNCHKWLYTKRGCAVLYVPSRNQHLIRSSIPTSWNYVPLDYRGPPAPTPNNFVAQFDRNGTIDVVPFLSVLPALEFREKLGGEERINKYCRDLAMKGGQRLAQLLATEVFPEELTLNMTNVRLPLVIPEGFPTETLAIMRVEMEDKLLRDWNCFAAVFVHDRKWWTRCSAQVFNDLVDFEHLAKALKAISEAMCEKYVG